MKRNTWLWAAVATTALSAGSANAATLVVNSFGAAGWTSWDTRDTSGAQLVGTNDTNALGPLYFAKSATAADDAAIEKQIVFMGEGQAVNDAAGNTPPASPTGSLSGKGYVRLDGTSANSGKSDISYVDASGIAAASTLNDPSFSASYRFYSVSSVSPYLSREPGLNISVIGTDLNQYTFNYTPGYAANAWNTENADSTTSQFSLYISGTGSVGSNTLAGWAASSYGSAIFGSGATIWRVGFNVGSSQHGGLDYLDSMQTSLLNGGDTIDFQAPAAVPVPAAVWGGLVLLGAMGGAELLRRRRLA